MEEKHKIVLIASAVLVAILVGGYLWRTSPTFKRTVTFYEKPKVIQETLTIPDTKAIGTVFGRTPSTEHYAVPLAPVTEGDKVIVENAILTLKGSFETALPKAEVWAKDAKLVLVTSQGAVTLEGKSSMWQVVFGSLSKKKGYEVIIQGDSIISEKELPTEEYGYGLPVDWYDADEAIRSIQFLPQFADATVSSINFFYNRDGKRWGYVLSTSRGTTSMPVR